MASRRRNTAAPMLPSPGDGRVMGPKLRRAVNAALGRAGAACDREAAGIARRLDDKQLREALSSIPERTLRARGACDLREVERLACCRDAFRAELIAREVVARRRDSTKRREKARAKTAEATAARRAEEFGPVAMKVSKRTPPSRFAKADPAGGVTQVVRGGAPGLGRRS